MKPRPKTLLWAMLLAATLWGVVSELTPRVRHPSRLARLPMRGIGFNGSELALDPSESVVFRRTTVIKRLYQVGRNQLVLLAASSQADRHAIHDPLYCFRGAGWTVTRETRSAIRGGQARIVHLARGHESAEAMYWITDGEHRHDSVLKAWWQSAMARLSRHSEDHEILLILLQPVVGTTLDWGELSDGFPELFDI